MTPTHIVLHHSLTADSTTVSWQTIRKYHTQHLGWTAIGYQAGIEDINGTYEILMGRMLNQTGAHTRQNGMNRCSIGLCLIGNFDANPVPEKQWDLAVKLVASLCDVLSIPVANIDGHRHYARYKSCPGAQFSVVKFCQDVEQAMPIFGHLGIERIV